MSFYVLPYSVIFLRFVPVALSAVFVLAASILVVRAIQGVLMTSPMLNRVASSLLTTVALGLAIFFVFVVTILVMPARAGAMPVKTSPQKTQRIVRDVTPLFAAADTQQFSARRHRHAQRRYQVATFRGGVDISIMTPQERSDYYNQGGQYYAVATRSAKRSVRRARVPMDANGNRASVGASAGLSLGGGGLVASARAYLGTNPTGRSRLWCGDFMAMIAPSAARQISNPRQARDWAQLPHIGAQVGAIAVLSRGRGGHVGVVVGFDGDNPIIVSGNHNRVVGEGVYPRSRVIAYVAGS